MNTRFTYLYRDACNYKQFGVLVLAGDLRVEDLRPLAHEGMYFIPSQVGLADLQPEPLTEDDHVWHELVDTEATDAHVTCDVSGPELLARFEGAEDGGWSECEALAARRVL